jgi:hypothetical protein
MNAGRVNDRIVLGFKPAEAQLLHRILGAVIRGYEMKPEEVDPRVAEVWYSKRGCTTAGLNEQQTREWIENLHGFKSANLAALRRWRTQLASTTSKAGTLQLTEEESHVLMTALNDHRLMTAARHDIGEDEMSMRNWEAIQSLKPRRQSALIDIMFLAGIIETILALLPGNYGDWPAYAK